MTSREIKEFLQTNTVEKLYKLYLKHFKILDEWDDKLIEGDLLNEYEVKKCGEQATGIYGKLSVVVNALESYKERIERNTEANYYRKVEKVKTTDTSVAKAEARDAINDLRDYFGDFKAYLDTAEKIMYFSQSRLKRETIVKGGKGVDATGDVNNAEERTW
jgi:hypothetical protein